MFPREVTWQIEQYDTKLTQSRDINHHRSLDVNRLEHYSTERNWLCVDRTEKHSEFKPTEKRYANETFTSK